MSDVIIALTSRPKPKRAVHPANSACQNGGVLRSGFGGSTGGESGGSAGRATTESPPASLTGMIGFSGLSGPFGFFGFPFLPPTLPMLLRSPAPLRSLPQELGDLHHRDPVIFLQPKQIVIVGYMMASERARRTPECGYRPGLL